MLLRLRNISSENLFILFAAFFLFAACIALWTKNYFILCLPFFVLLFFSSLFQIKYLFFSLLFLIPFSVELQVGQSLGTDFPDEQLMWISSSLVGLILLFNSKQKIKFLHLKHSLIFLLSLIVIWCGISTLFSTYPIISLKYLLSKSWYLATFFILPIILFNKAKQLQQMLWIIVMAMLCIVVYAILKQIAIGFSFILVNDAVQPFFRNHVTFSALLACIIPILFIQWKKSSSWTKKILGLIILLCLANLLFAYSRGAWLALFCCIPFYFLLKKNKLKKALHIIGLLLIIGISLFISTGSYQYLKPDKSKTIFHTQIKDHLKATYELTDMSFAERFYRWIAGTKMLAAKPVLGFGPNTFYKNYKAYTISSFETWVSDNKDKSSLHNYYLSQFAEQGIIGGILFILLIYFSFSEIEYLYFKSKRKNRDLILALGFVLTIISIELLVNDLIETDKIGSVFYLCLASIVILSTNLKKDSLTYK